MSHELKFNDRNFEEEVIKSELPVLVDFWASWCPPCKMVEPVIAELAEEYAGKVKVGKLHVDQNPRIASKYGVMGLPTFIIFNGGKEVQRKVGAQSKGQLRKMLEVIIREVSSKRCM